MFWPLNHWSVFLEWDFGITMFPQAWSQAFWFLKKCCYFLTEDWDNQGYLIRQKGWAELPISDEGSLDQTKISRKPGLEAWFKVAQRQLLKQKGQCFQIFVEGGAEELWALGWERFILFCSKSSTRDFCARSVKLMEDSNFSFYQINCWLSDLPSLNEWEKLGGTKICT